MLGLFFQEEEPSKNKRMPLSAASTRYSLVKGERIVRSVFTARLRWLSRVVRLLYKGAPHLVDSLFSDMG